ncbi:NAD-dependent epimerase/dehydratase family protein [Paucisalibacillus sp. EB02]|uniref:NAD-dependent epimerase/dehydratase family protein n=1 Tax=Paucisalibacillus sp. EB02 TaxID=1347087 RepID=UPI0004BBCA66|nr:NAD-dependent epimerase/dehydratase family protein [Paucisalibacillus sp. EB02]
MDILVLGGTRFLGRFIVSYALEKGHQVTLFNRGNNQDVFPDLEQLTGDRFRDLDVLKGRKWDAVIDTSGFIPHTVENSSRVLQDASHYTFISSCSVYKNHYDPGTDENDVVLSLSQEKLAEITKTADGPLYGEYYGHLKAMSEKTIEKSFPGKVLNIRPGLIVGPYDYTDRFSYWIKRVAEGGEVLAPGRPERSIQFIDVRDLAKWTIELVEKNVSGTFNAIGPDYELSMKSFLEECRKVSNSEATYTWVPEKFLMENKVGPWGEMPLWIPEEFPLEEGGKPWKGFMAFSNRKGITNGLTFRPISETIQATLEWENLRSGEEDRKAGMRAERERELLRLFRQTVR